VRVLIVEDEPYLAEAIRDGLRLEAIAADIVASGSGMPILMLTAADRLDDKATGFGLGADDAWDENADPFTNAVRITVSALRKRLGEPAIIATVAGVGYRIDTERSLSERADDTAPCTGPEGSKPWIGRLG
jgi:DNA-binding response OmpR family regulator